MALTKVQTIGIETGISLTGVTTITTINASTDTLSVGGTVNFGGNVSIAGTLTYEDVTNIDSVGIITARSAIVLSDDNAIHFRGVVTDDADAILRASAGGGQLLINSRNDAIINIDANNDSTDAHFAVAHGAATGSSTELFRVQEDGSIGAGTDNPLATFHIARGSDDDSILYITGADTSSEFVALGVGANYGMLTAGGSGSTSTDLIFRTANSGTEAERMRIDSSGRLLSGLTSSSASASAVFQGFAGSSAGQAILQLQVGKNNAATANNENLGSVRFGNSDAALGAIISSEADGQWASNDYPARLTFRTTADGASSTTERMRIDSAGQVIIGATSAGGLFSVHQSASSANYINITNGVTGSSSWSNGMLLGPNASGDALVWQNENLALRFGTNNTDRMRIAANGDVGIGIAPAAQKLQVHESTSSTESYVHITNAVSGGTSSDGMLLGLDTSANAIVWNSENTVLKFATNNTERMRITNDGYLRASNTGSISGSTNYHTITSNVNTYRSLAVENSSNASGDGTYYSYLGSNANNTSSYHFVGATQGVDKVLIYGNGNIVNSNNSYSQLSDIKLKENIVDASSQWNDLKALQIRNWNFKEETGYGTHTQIGVVAQEIETVSPGLVEETPDHDEDGNDLGTVTKSVKYSVLYMKAVKALQEAQTRIESLEARLDAGGL